MKLYSAWYCPFAQRAWLSSLHKGLDFEYIETDPYNKTPSWIDISRGATQVPALETVSSTGEISRVIDSLRIVEFIDDYQRRDGLELFPGTPEQKAETKYWIDFLGSQVIPYFYRFLKAHVAGDSRNESKHNLLKGMRIFTQAMSDDGPFFSGSQFGAVDIAFAPFAHRIKLILAHYRHFHLSDQIGDWSQYNRWYDAVITEPSFRKTSFDQQDYERRLIDFYLSYSLGGGQSDVTKV